MNTEKFAGDTNKRPEGMLQVGAVVQSRYKVLGVLGVERSGLVYLARDLHSPTVQRLLAVKEMLTADPNLRHRSGLLDQFHVEEILDLTADPFLREMALKNFEREANILAELNHPAIPEISDYFSSNDRAYLVRQYINGKDLEAIVNAVPDFLPLNVVRKWAIELCDVLDYLHTYRPPIVFRDIRPSNIMVDQVGKVHLIDFGLAKRFQPNYEGTRYGAEGYSPPEQYRGEVVLKR